MSRLKKILIGAGCAALISVIIAGCILLFFPCETGIGGYLSCTSWGSTTTHEGNDLVIVVHNTCRKNCDATSANPEDLLALNVSVTTPENATIWLENTTLHAEERVVFYGVLPAGRNNTVSALVQYRGARGDIIWQYILDHNTF